MKTSDSDTKQGVNPPPCGIVLNALETNDDNNECSSEQKDLSSTPASSKPVQTTPEGPCLTETAHVFESSASSRTLDNIKEEAVAQFQSSEPINQHDDEFHRAPKTSHPAPSMYFDSKSWLKQDMMEFPIVRQDVKPRQQPGKVPPPQLHVQSPITPVMRPGAIAVPGIDAAVLGAARNVVEQELSSSSQHHHKPAAERRPSMARAINVSSEELVREYREQVLQGVVCATHVVPEESTTRRMSPRKSKIVMLVVLVGLAVLVLVAAGIFFLQRSNKESSSILAPAASPTARNELHDHIAPYLHDRGESLDDPNSLYAKVFDRLANDPVYDFDEEGEIVVFRFALIVFFEQTQGDQWSNNTNWNTTSTTVCDWYGITCEADGSHRGQRQLMEPDSGDDSRESGSRMDGDGGSSDNNHHDGAYYLDLSGNNLQGALIPELGFMKWIRLDLSNNQLTGTLPLQLEALRDFALIDLSGNHQLGGSVPFSMCLHANPSSRTIRVDCGQVECSCCTPSCSV